MQMILQRRSSLFAIGMVIGAPLLEALLSRCVAMPMDTNEDVESMTRKLRSRGRRGKGIESFVAERQTIERLRSVRKKRGLNLQERGELYAATRYMPQLDLEIFFAFDSAVVQPEAAVKLDKLGEVLIKPEFNGNTIVINGHTDRKGTADYNLTLSERRALAVAKYLVEKFELDSDKLMATGYGFTHLKNSADPFASENRRVQIVNAGR